MENYTVDNINEVDDLHNKYFNNDKEKDYVFTCKNVNLSYGEKQVLFNINANFIRNKVTAFIGPSGCGKSTLLRCLNRMNDTISSCKIDGEFVFSYKDQNGNIIKNDINDMKAMNLRTKVGMVFQQPNQFPMSIYDNVSYGPRCSGLKNKKKLDEIVRKSLIKAALYDEVSDRLHSSALSLSGGQQQRLCIARAIAMEPMVILMDEPTSALDPIATRKIEELINELKDSYTIIIVTHNMQQAARISDYTFFFLLGEIIESSKTEKLFRNPKEKKTEDYITGRFG